MLMSAGNPLSYVDPNGLYCLPSSSGGTICSHPDGSTFNLPTPKGFDHFTGEEFLYHDYDISVPLGDADAACVMQKIIENPTPGDPSPATPDGTSNNASVPIVAPRNPVTSHLTTDLFTGNSIVVNMSGANSAFRSGYVARGVSNGRAFTRGEGTNWKQSPNIWGEITQDTANNLLWGNQLRQFIDECSCGG